MINQDIPNHDPSGHSCNLDSWYSNYGGAASACAQDTEGHFWIENGEYASMVPYCPVCGERAPKFTPGEGDWAERDSAS